MSNQHDFGLIGLGTMGKALLLNMLDHGHNVVGYNRTASKAIAIEEETGGKLKVYSDIEEFVKSIRRPRAIMLLVTAGAATDEVIQGMLPYLEPGDFIIDGGNAHFPDTERRLTELEAQGFGFMGMGVSGGEEGARKGPSMMPGGTVEQYARVAPIFESVSAKFDGQPCVALMGNRSAGHYVKMVHNGIEYAIMQAIAEVYDVFSRGQGKPATEIAEIFGHWNEDELGCFLVEITHQVLAKIDPDTGKSLVDVISDKAKAKGTGKWTTQDSMDIGLPIPSIDASVAARMLSNYQEERGIASTKLGDETPMAFFNVTEQDLHDALLAVQLISYAQGLALIKIASDERNYQTNLETVAKVWRAGCIIRSYQLEPIRAAFATNPELKNILLDDQIGAKVASLIPALRRVVSTASLNGLPVPVLSSALSYFDGYRSARLPANLIQGLRDLFGAHTYERIDKPGNFHTEWTES